MSAIDRPRIEQIGLGALRAALFALAIVACGMGQCLSEEVKSDPLEKLRFSYEVQLERVAMPVTKGYLAALTRLQEEYSKAGDLAGAVAVRAEKEGFEAGESAKPDPGEELPLATAPKKGSRIALDDLRSTYDEHIAIAKAKVDKIYLDALLKLEKDFTRKGELDEALVVNAERKRIGDSAAGVGRAATEKVGEKALSDLEKFLIREWDRNGDHLFVEFVADGSALHRWEGNSAKLWGKGDAAKAKWEVVEDEVTLREFRNDILQSTWKVTKLSSKTIRISPVEISGKDWISGEFKKSRR